MKTYKGSPARRMSTFMILVGAWAGGFQAVGEENLLQNGGFESNAEGDNFANLGGWEIFWGGEWGGEVVGVADCAPASGAKALRVNAFGAVTGDWEKGIGQSFPVSTSDLYEVFAMLASPGGPNYFSPTNGLCLLRLEYFDAAGLSLGGANCEPEFRAGGPTQWTRYGTGAVSVPAGAVTGCVYFLYWPGGDSTLNQYVFLDDASATTTAVERAGALENPGFEIRNPAGRRLVNVPYWTAFGESGSVVTDRARTGRRALQIWYTENLAGQIWPASPGSAYVSSAWLSSTNFTTTNAFGLVIQQFLDATGTNVLLQHLSPRFDAASASSDWVRYEASGTAPNGAVYGRTLVGIVGPAIDFGTSSIWVDDVDQGVVGLSAWEQWQWEQFGTNDGEYVTADGDYDHDGCDNWSEFIAGTQPTNGGSLLSLSPSQRSGNSYIIEWPSVAGRYYTVERCATLDGSSFNALAAGLPSVSPANAYTDNPPPGLLFFYRVSVTTNAP